MNDWGSRGVWAILGGRLPGGSGPASGDGVWERLRTLVDPAEDRPKLADDIEIQEFRLRWGNDYAMVANPRELLHYKLTPSELATVRLMDGSRTVKEIVMERLRESGDLEVSAVADLVYELRIGNFLDRPFLDTGAILERALHPNPGRVQRFGRFFRTLRVDWHHADRLVRWFYRNGVRWFFRPSALALGAALAIGGFLAFLSIVGVGRVDLGGGSLAIASPWVGGSNWFHLGGESLAIAFLILLALNYFLTFVHELGHAVVLTHHGRRVKSAGFMIYFGSPAFFVESSDGLMLNRGQRIMGAFAGPYAESLVSGTAALLVWLFPDAAFSSLLYKFAVLNYVVLFMNLIPLLELDGYWILSDVIQVPDLRPRSLAFIRHDLWHKLRGRSGFSKQEVGLALYGILGVLFTIFSFYTAFFFWRHVFGGLLGSLWRGGVVARAVLFVLVLVIAGPVVRGLINLTRALLRRLRALLVQVRFRLERGWRVEAARLIDALPIFRDVPHEALDNLAGRVRLRSVARGQPVVRQGERATAFYVVRQGSLEVVEEDSDRGNERVLRVLGPGESFGELGLAQAAPRSATVRALEEGQLFEIDKGTFDRLLADMVDVPRFEPTIQAIAELRGLPCFAHLEPDDLSQLLEHGRWVNLRPGEVVVEMGAPGDAFYAIRSGRVDVIKDGSRVSTLGPGSYFGEVALLLDVPRTASVVTATPVRAYRLDREGFDRVIRDAFRTGTLNPHISPDRTWQH
jgi:CRP-like cAMP-binding protein